jgi:Leucine-rich repeat (LRR) protein
MKNKQQKLVIDKDNGIIFGSNYCMVNRYRYISHLYISNQPNLNYLPSFVYFVCLKYISISGTSIETVPNVRNDVYCICIPHNKIKHIDKLPDNLKIFYCENNNIDNLPTLPRKLTDLKCSHNNITNLPTLPFNLEYLDCSHNNITNLPTLPINLSELNCSHNNITTLPILQHKLTHLNCSNNNITNLPTLPFNLIDLNCSHNNIKHLPKLNNSLVRLNEDNYNAFFINNSLLRLNADNNNIFAINKSFVDELPNYFNISLNNNPLYLLPLLPHFHENKKIYITKSSLYELYHLHIGIHNFRFTYFILKYKKKFMKWMYGRLREERIQREMHPDNIDVKKILNDDYLIY